MNRLLYERTKDRVTATLMIVFFLRCETCEKATFVVAGDTVVYIGIYMYHSVVVI